MKNHNFHETSQATAVVPSSEMECPLIVNLSQVTQRSTLLVGGKGANLGELIHADIPVPPGFVVTTAAFKRYLDCPLSGNNNISSLGHKIREILKHSDVQNQESSYELLSQELQTLLRTVEIPADIEHAIIGAAKALISQNSPTPLFVAVRSSAITEDSLTATWAGQLDTYLCVNEKNLIRDVFKCWCSLYSPRALFYRFKQNLNEGDGEQENILVAVVVQQMINSEISGVGFSIHPLSQNPHQVVIEAIEGLGEALVSGEVTPDNYEGP